MNYHNITKDDMNNGDGLRVVLWVAGCSHHCKGCQNPVTWNPDDGIEFDIRAKKEIFKELKKKHIAGITFSGGDPLFSTNKGTVFCLCQEIKKKFPTKTIKPSMNIFRMLITMDILETCILCKNREFQSQFQLTKRKC